MIQGVIEGFFGKDWSFKERHLQLQFMKEFHYHAYIYAPKNDRKLRTDWQEKWTDFEVDELCALSKAAHDHEIKFGMGLSPINLYRDLKESQLHSLRLKVDQILEIGIDLLAVCFDDMKADVPGLAQLQVQLTHQIQSWCPHVEVILCPSYYSFDPILERVFGDRPVDYWTTLKEELNESIGIFWTGPQVCSTHYPLGHLSSVLALLGDRLHIWDNYPVNDGRQMVDYLHLKAPSGRDHLPQYTQAQWVNPMVQPFLSRFALAAMSQPHLYLPDSRERQSMIFRQVLEWEVSVLRDLPKRDDLLSSVSIWTEWLMDHLDLFQNRGLAVIPIAMRRELQQDLETCPFLFATEMRSWLNNNYAFDPACLT